MTRIVDLVALLHQHHAIEAALLERIRGGMQRAHFDQSNLRAVHDELEGDILYQMAEMTEDEIMAALDAYEADGGYL
jgi:hypothetical protein